MATKTSTSIENIKGDREVECASSGIPNDLELIGYVKALTLYETYGELEIEYSDGRVEKITWPIDPTKNETIVHSCSEDEDEE
jgi:hypothetical protein